MKKLNELLDKVRALLQGEPLRAITYGSAVVIWLVVGIANAIGYTKFGPTISIENALLDATAAGVLLTELGRRWVFSPATVATIAVAPSPIVAAVEVGVPIETLSNAVDEANTD